jgi:hypothetical protein
LIKHAPGSLPQRVDVTSWVQNRDPITIDTIVVWKTKRDVEKLQSQSDKAERYAAAAAEVATAKSSINKETL